MADTCPAVKLKASTIRVRNDGNISYFFVYKINHSNCVKQSPYNKNRPLIASNDVITIPEKKAQVKRISLYTIDK